MVPKHLIPLLRRGVAEILIEEELVRLLESGKPLRLKQGFDPSRPDIHLGHVVGLRKLRQFQELGHQVILIVGDWTAQIGDPSGMSATRLMLSAEEVRANALTYMDQFFQVVDRNKTQVMWQSEWFGKFSLSDVISLTSRFTVAQILARDDFSKRYNSGRPLAITELLYPLLQAHDSVVIEADVEFGGTDQKFNCLVGRELQGMVGQRPQQVFLVPILVGTDGSQKMSKSLGNYIAINEPPQDMYGKIMSIPDALMLNYFELLTDVPDEELEEYRRQLQTGAGNPMEWKKRLARDIVAQFHSAKAAQHAEEHFVRVFQKRELPAEIPERTLFTGQLRASFLLFHPESTDEEIDSSSETMVDVPDLLMEVGFAASRSQGRRLLDQGAVELDGELTLTQKARVRDGSVLRAGKRRFVRLRLRNADAT